MDPIRGVESLMFRGLQGNLIRGARFAHIRATQADLFVFFSYATIFAVSVILSLTASSFAISLVLYLLWSGLGFVYIALGTKLAHNFAAWGIGMAATLVSLGGVWSSIVRLSTDDGVNSLYDKDSESPGVLALQLIVFVALAVVFGFLTVVMARFIARMSQSGSRLQTVPLSAPGVPGPPPIIAGTIEHSPATSFSPHNESAPPPPVVGDGAPLPTTPSVALSDQTLHQQPDRSSPQLPAAAGQEFAGVAAPAPPEIYGRHPAAPMPAPKPSNPVVAIIAGALFLIPVFGTYWLQEFAYQHLYGQSYDWLWPVMLTAPSVVLVLAVLARARRGRRLAAVAVALVTVVVTAALHVWATNVVYFSHDDRVSWVYASTIIPTVGAVLAWGIARRRGAVWLAAVPVAGALSALWTWIAWFNESTNASTWPLLETWWGVCVSDVWPVVAGILFAWLLDVATHREKAPAFAVGGALIGCACGILALSVVAAVVIAEESARQDFTVMGSPYPDEYFRGGDHTERMQPGPMTVSSVDAIRNTDVGSCLRFEYAIPRRSDGTRPASATNSPCSTGATMVGSITTSPALCSGNWIRLEGPGSDNKVRCLLVVR